MVSVPVLSPDVQERQVIELRASYDRQTNLWSCVCDCGWELELHTYPTMRIYRRLHVSTHAAKRQKVVCS